MAPSKHGSKAAINMNNDGQILNGSQDSAGVHSRDQPLRRYEATNLNVSGEPPRAQPPAGLGVINAGVTTGQLAINHRVNVYNRSSRQSVVSSGSGDAPACALNPPQSQFVIPQNQMDQATLRPTRVDSRQASVIYRPADLQSELRNRQQFQSQGSASTVYVPIHINSPENHSTLSFQPSPSVLSNSSSAYQPSLLGTPNQSARGPNFPAYPPSSKMYSNRPGNWNGIREAEAQEEIRNPRVNQLTMLISVKIQNGAEQEWIKQCKRQARESIKMRRFDWDLLLDKRQGAAQFQGYIEPHDLEMALSQLNMDTMDTTAPAYLAQDQWAKTQLRKIGKTCNRGCRWNRVKGGYRCDAGFHWATDYMVSQGLGEVIYFLPSGRDARAVPAGFPNQPAWYVPPGCDRPRPVLPPGFKSILKKY
ncbi:hypothetical protein EYC84_007963 [Monilinia fructicola]|uniref:Uncharacterized protein n=1 Tax=Monilinia fructicola TaxID=38448 RepID=A0A5M9JHS7_MONFR|nr:hypothetical protein EYC84_007963 [Monilinia fructicola]